MKYWFFDGNDVVGPFAPAELAANKSFGATSLICPENFSDDGDHWQPATLFAEIKELLARKETDHNDNPETFEQEMDTLLKQRSPLSFDEEPTDGPGLQIPVKPAKPGPIEDYFNHIKKEDLGDILGIPDPNDNSDMDLAHALEKQLANTSSTRRKERQEQISQTDKQTVKQLEATHHVATATEVFGAPAPLREETPTLPTLPSATMPIVAIDKPSSPKPQQELAPLNVQPAPKETLPPLKENNSTKRTTAPATTSKKEEKSTIIPDPALLRAEQIQTSSVRARLKQTQEIKDFLQETQSSRLRDSQYRQRLFTVTLLAALAIVGALLLTLQFSRIKQTAPIATQTDAAVTTHAQELLNEPTPVAPPPVAPTPEQKALEIVQNYPLSDARGTLAAYLNKIYQTQLSQGYTASWAAEPLYKNTYVVKYQLTKTRKEPIIYVFQADVITQKLTGALNNISLDLVGKI